MNRFRPPTASDDNATCEDCGDTHHHESLYKCKDDKHRCEDCFQIYKEKKELEKEGYDSKITLSKCNSCKHARVLPWNKPCSNCNQYWPEIGSPSNNTNNWEKLP